MPLRPLPHRVLPGSLIKPRLFAALLLGVLVCGAALWLGRAGPARSQAPIGLFSSIPLLFAETGELTLDAPPPWPRAVIADHGPPVPLDSLTGEGGRSPLAGIDRLVVAQPRALSPAESVALDAWVRAGGRLLLLADPMYTGHSPFALGDPRRPQAIAMLSPLLDHWGLRLDFDNQQAGGVHTASAMGLSVPVDLPGRFSIVRGSDCRLWDQGLVASCRIGMGRVYALADATVIDPDGEDAAHVKALSGLLDAAFAAR